jgi:SH3-like domain-containing protein
MYIVRLLLICVLMALPVIKPYAVAAKGRETGLPIPRFINLKSDEVNLRTGPGNKYPIKWVYKRRGYPLLVVGEFGNWRKVQDIDGQEGWVHQVLVARAQKAIVFKASANVNFALPANQVAMLRKPNENSYPLARLETGSLVTVEKCRGAWCLVSQKKMKGWLLKDNLWGVSP